MRGEERGKEGEERGKGDKREERGEGGRLVVYVWRIWEIGNSICLFINTYM